MVLGFLKKSAITKKQDYLNLSFAPVERLTILNRGMVETVDTSFNHSTKPSLNQIQKSVISFETPRGNLQQITRYLSYCFSLPRT